MSPHILSLPTFLKVAKTSESCLQSEFNLSFRRGANLIIFAFCCVILLFDFCYLIFSPHPSPFTIQLKTQNWRLKTANCSFRTIRAGGCKKRTQKAHVFAYFYQLFTHFYSFLNVFDHFFEPTCAFDAKIILPFLPVPPLAAFKVVTDYWWFF